MRLDGLLSLMQQAPRYRALLDQLRAGEQPADQRLLRAARSFVDAALAQDLNRPLLIVTARVERAYTVAEQLPVWLPGRSVLRFTEPSSLFYERSPWAAATIRSRISVLSALCPPVGMSDSNPGAPPPVIVASSLALMQHTLPVREFRVSSRLIKVGQQADPDKLLRTWLGIGYTPATIVAEPGTFSRRGGIVDVFPITANHPVRIEFFGDEIESLRMFDPTTQRSAENIKQVLINPAREALPRLAGEVARHLHNWFEQQPATDEDVTSAQPDQADLASESAFPQLEFYLPYFYSQPASLLDYLPENTQIVVEDWGALNDVMADFETQAVSQRAEKLEANQIPPDYPLPYWTWDELHEALSEHKPLHWAGSALADDKPQVPVVGELFAPGPHFGGQLRTLMDSLRAYGNGGDRVVVISNQALRLTELWNEQSAESVETVGSLTTLPDGLTFVEGTMTEGWTFKPDSPDIRPLHVLTDAEIFGWKRPEPRRHPAQRARSPESYFADMAPGDYVVHTEYGIGRFVGLKKRRLEGNEREYLVIEFAGSDTLYVPIHQADRLTRYVGADDQEPTLSKLGSSEWSKTKETAREAAEAVARELLELYARRANVHGHAFSPDSPWQHELEASFPYIETEDQVQVLQEVKADMESPQPMDRLICGDVGYGKTEIALRAAFKAVMDGKQVAILVPTTVLAQQHFTTFSQRLAPFPVTVEMLSRFRTRQEQKDILELTAVGGVDILIGTHRLLQPDVVFRDLGLLIIDEEQRFGVTHKERLKQMRTEVDVLTLTATPIPRTMYMSLSGIRDISIINTPPEERLPVLTHVGPYDEKLVRQAILRELDREGQVFYLHNRVSTIQAIARRLSELVPEALIAVGHGQMPEEQLEEVMAAFAAGEYDVLLCTTIIESGLDIPNANTIIIDRADTFGLAQLYQLRGRVGRGTNRAYAYLFHPRISRLTDDARARLETIAEQTELGAGMSIAMRDLEIRGAGDLLGTRQSGYITSVGFHLYTQLLAQAVQKLKSGGKVTADMLATTGPTITIDLPVPAYIPVDFLPEVSLRLQLYRRLADLHDEAAIDEMRAELTDRFGILPPPVEGLLFQLRVKLRAQRTHITAIMSEDSQVSIKLPYLAEVDRPALQRYLGNDTRVSRVAVWLPREPDSSAWQTRLLDVLERLQISETAAA
ncbi:MAG: transcription-repair coupling factor [Anaerolineae bacterium]|nr:transcription-repair coupling factor [Anaerolineae bacterium]